MSGGGQQKATHALLLASVSALLSSMLLEVYDTEEDMILLLPDFSMEEVKTCLQAIMSSEGLISGGNILSKHLMRNICARYVARYPKIKLN